jgi:hypothetical protein
MTVSSQVRLETAGLSDFKEENIRAYFGGTLAEDEERLQFF